MNEEAATGRPRKSLGEPSPAQRWSPLPALLQAAPLALYAIVAAAILSPLLYKRGYPFSFDMSFGPHMKLPEEAFGLGPEFGRRLPDFIWISLIAKVFPAEFVAKAVLLVIPFTAGTLAYWASRRLVSRVGLTTAGAIYAGLLYELNPFVYQRFLAGHWHILLGYAFFPMMVVAAVDLVSSTESLEMTSFGRRGDSEPPITKKAGARCGLWGVAFASAILGVTSFAVSVMGLATLLLVIAVVNSRQRANLGDGLQREGIDRKGRFSRIRGKAKLAASCVAVWVLANATWIVPALVKSEKAGDFSDLDWRAFLVRGQDQWEAFLNVVRLVGFYREDFAPPSVSRPTGWLACGAVIALFLAGIVAVYRRDPGLFALSILAPAVFLFLALGERAPFIGPLLGWAYPRLPGWQIFRESQKLLVPVCFFYASLGGLGVSRLVSVAVEHGFRAEASSNSGLPAHGPRLSGRLSPEAVAMLAAALMVPIALSPDLFFGLRGRISVSPYPPGWYEAASVLPPGDGRLLVFPWHQHLAFEFTGGMTNVNPAQDFFPKEVVQSNRAEFPGFILGVSDPIDSYVRDLIALGPTLTDIATALRPLGVDSVVVLKTADWSSYEFLEGEKGLRRIVDNDALRLYTVEELTGSVAGFRLQSELARVQVSSVAASDEPALVAADCSQAATGQVLRVAPFVYRVPAAGCWLVPVTFDTGWRARGVVGRAWSGAALGVFVEEGSSVVYTPAFLAIGGHLVTAAALIVAAAGLTQRKRGFRHLRSHGA